YIEAMKRSGISPLLPCVNRSTRVWSPEAGGVRCGLSGIVRLSSDGTDALLVERERGVYKSLSELVSRVTLMPNDLVQLILAGAIDSTTRSRAALLREAGFAEPPPLALRNPGPWPVSGTPGRYPLCGQYAQEWGCLGWLAGPPVAAVVRAWLAAGD